MAKKQSKTQAKRIARERVDGYFKLAEKVFKENKGLANRYVTLARKTAMKYQIRIPNQWKKRYCKHCYKYLIPGVNVRVRTAEGHVVYHCSECKKYMRFPY